MGRTADLRTSFATTVQENIVFGVEQTRAAGLALWRTSKETAAAVLLRRDSVSGAWTRSLAEQATDWAESQQKREALVLLGGFLLLDRLLDTAADTHTSSGDQVTAERAVLLLLESDKTASLLLSRRGAVPRLLQLVAQSSHVDQAAAAVSHAVHAISLGSSASLDDIRQTIACVSCKDGEQVQQLAVQFLANWADSSIINCGKITVLGGGAALSAALQGAHERSEPYKKEVLNAMAVLARDCPMRMQLELQSWLRPLLWQAADAVAAGQWSLAAQALDALSTCLHHDSHLEEALVQSNAFPLLRQLAVINNSEVQRAVLTAVHTLVAPVASLSCLLPEAELDFWQYKMQEWICRDPADQQICTSAAAVLEALAHEPGAQGMLAAADWLETMLLHLASDVQAYHSIRQDPGQDAAAARYADAVSILPAYARGIATELRALWIRPEELPTDAESPLPLHSIRALPKAAKAVDSAVLDAVLCRALKVLCALVASSNDKQRWLYSAGILPLLHRLTLGRSLGLDEEVAELAGEQLLLSPCVQHQSARLLAMVTAHIVQPGHMLAWEAWLQDAAQAEDCKLSSHATRALLHLRSACMRAAAQQTDPFQGVAQLGMHADDIAKQHISHTLPLPLVYRDGVHLFSPGAQHHGMLADEGCSSVSPGAPVLDIVFVHGIRGGPFASWREWDSQATNVAPAKRRIVHERCWPSAWLASDLPQARLLSMQYAAPASGWEGESLPLWGTVEQLIDGLTAAGIGQRPVVFVSHSMGGILVKEMLAKALQPNAPAHRRQLAEAAQGLVFYACPHLGSWLADWGWTMRWLGASPAAAVLHLKPGPHLQAVNELIREQHNAGRMPVLSFGEGKGTAISAVLPFMLVVPPEAAYPGYGKFILLEDSNHINTCKPSRRDDTAYTATLDFLQQCARQAAERECSSETNEQVADVPHAN